MSLLHIRPVHGGPELDEVRHLLHEYQAHLTTTIDPTLLRHRDDELAALPAGFLPPTGALLLASRDGAGLGCAGLRRAPLSATSTLDPATTGEFCRLWVTPAARGEHIGRHLLAHAIALARTAAYTTLVLNSVTSSMEAAQSLYTRVGFRPIPAYKHVPIPDIAFFGLDLVSTEP